MFFCGVYESSLFVTQVGKKLEAVFACQDEGEVLSRVLSLYHITLKGLEPPTETAWTVQLLLLAV